MFDNEAVLLRGAGHDVHTLETSNYDVNGLAGKITAAGQALYSLRGRRLMGRTLDAVRPEVVHVHNFFPFPSPSLLDAARERGTPVVWTLHNYRVTCANGLLFRDGKPCEQCLGGTAWWGMVHRCYRGSLLGSAAVAGMIELHRALRTYETKVTRFIVLNAFARSIALRAGLPGERIAIKPNFAEDPGRPATAARDRFLYLGRLSVEKGVRTLVEAWNQVGAPLDIVGDGPERASLEAIAPPNIRFRGALGRADVRAALAGARALIVPSIWFENYPMTVVEARAAGTPVIASRLGALEHLVDDGVDGVHFEAGEPRSLAAAARALWTMPPFGHAAMCAAARARYERENAPERNLAMLLSIYADAIGDGGAVGG